MGHLLPEGAIVVDEAQTSGTLLPGFTAGAPRHALLARAPAQPGPQLIKAVVPSAFSGLKLRVLPWLLRALDQMPLPVARALKRKLAP